MNRFGLSCWTYFRLSEASDSLAKDYYELGLNVPLTPIFGEGESDEKMLQLLDEFHKYGMQAIVYDERIVAHKCKGKTKEEYRELFKVSLEQFGKHPAVYGFYVGDEPDAEEASVYFELARIQREMAPNLCPYLNLLPWFDWIAERMGAKDYASYLDRAVDEGNLAMLGYDCYTQMYEGDQGYDVYFDNLRTMRDASNKYHIPFCSTIASCGHYDYLPPDQNAYRWQISTAAALGAKMLSYFYIKPHLIEHNYRCFPINFFNDRTPSYHWLSEENRLFTYRFAELLFGLTCVKSEFTIKNYGGLEMFKPDETLVHAFNIKDVNMLISTFVDEKGTKYRVVVNMDRNTNVVAGLNFAPNVKVEQFMGDKTWKEWVGYTDAVGALTNEESCVTMWMAPGQMEILRETPIEK